MRCQFQKVHDHDDHRAQSDWLACLLEQHDNVQWTVDSGHRTLAMYTVHCTRGLGQKANASNAAAAAAHTSACMYVCMLSAWNSNYRSPFAARMTALRHFVSSCMILLFCAHGMAVCYSLSRNQKVQLEQREQKRTRHHDICDVVNLMLSFSAPPVVQYTANDRHTA